MALTGKVLGEGQVAASLTTVYTVPASSTAITPVINACNTAAASKWLKIYVHTATSDRLILNKVLRGNGGSIMFRIAMALETADTIGLHAETAAVIDYVITGGVEA